MEAIAACSSASLARTLASLSLPRSRVRVRVPERRGRGRAVVAATASTCNYAVPLDAAPSGITRPLIEILRNLNKPVPEIIILPTSRRASASDPVIPWYHANRMLSFYAPVAASVSLQSDKVEDLQSEASFMSEQASVYLGLVGLLGEYSRSTRKRHKFLLPCKHGECVA